MAHAELIGRVTVEHFKSLPRWQVTGLARGSPDFEARAAWLYVDLQDRGAYMALANESALCSVSHLAYTALFERFYMNLREGSCGYHHYK